MSTRQIQKLMKNDEPVFLAVVRTLNDFVPRGGKAKKGNKQSPGYAAVNISHGMTEGQRRRINKETGSEKYNYRERERTGSSR